MSGLDLENEIRRRLELYTKEVTATTEAAIKDVMEEGRRVIKNMGGYTDRTGKYRKGFYVKDVSNYKGPKLRLGNKQYQLTHLLEYGHAIKGGTGRTRVFPHWKFTEEYITKRFAEELEKRLSDSP